MHLVGLVIAGESIHDDVDAGAVGEFPLPLAFGDGGEQGLSVRAHRPARGVVVGADDNRAHAVVALRIARCLKPVIGAFNGAAVGVGVTMTLPMDVRLASEKAKFGFVFARRGVVPEACSTWFLPRIVGIARAAEWTYTGRVFGADEALAGGLVSRVVPPDALLPQATALAREIADTTSAVSVALIRQMLWRMLGADHPREAHRLDSLAMWHTGRSADAHEGITSFLEKRPPRFTGRPSKDMPAFYPWWR